MSTTDSGSHSVWQYLTDTLGAFAAVWGVAIGVLLVGLPLALAFALALRLARMVFPSL